MKCENGWYPECWSDCPYKDDKYNCHIAREEAESEKEGTSK